MKSLEQLIKEYGNACYANDNDDLTLTLEREPLSDGITDMWLQSMGNIYKFARMIEKAHGITHD